MKFVKMFMLIAFLTLLLVACGESNSKQGSIEKTSESFVQALIDGDKEVIEKINRDTNYPADYVLSDLSPKYQGLQLDDINFEYEDNEVKITHKLKEENVRYKLKIEKIGEEYFVVTII
ncbi:hypothetical protein MKX83_24090 [Cytobacillus sp. FSL M8-0252]|uniref:hypothetical protein n=1 Tax=Cytobacillus sp. FSL M8-0252 TaxID=2921621 RepID=UPI0030F93F81